MKQVRKSVLLWYSPREMYSLVTAVEQYPQFLPWCAQAEVLERHEDGMTAKMHMAYRGVRHAFITRNVHREDECVTIGLVDGPFSLLDGTWRFLPLAAPGGAAAQACKIEFEMRYAFANRALEALISPAFDHVANTLVDTFVTRAEKVYGSR
jgi:ribosome-associated toxin RatA of RatAB toxin-antitoxin module